MTDMNKEFAVLGHPPTDTSGQPEPSKQETTNVSPEVSAKPAVLPEVIAKMREAANKRLQEMKEERKEEVVTGAVNSKTEPVDSQTQELEVKCNTILAEYGGLEGNIPVHHVYWTLRNIIRSSKKKF